MSAYAQRTDYLSDRNFRYFGTGAGTLSQSGLLTSRHGEFEQQWAECIADLRRLRSLPEDWDGEGATPPRPEVVDSVEELLLELRSDNFRNKQTQTTPPPSRIVASHNGSVVVEWQLEGGVYYEVECAEPYRAESMTVILDQEAIHKEMVWGQNATESQFDEYTKVA